MEEITISTSKKYEIIDITDLVNEKIKKDAKACLVFVPHATAALIVNENYDPNIEKDFLDLLSKVIPEGVWRHDRIDGNGAAHLKSALIGPSVFLPVKNGKLLLGTWQSLMFCEFDGPREKRKILIECF